MDAVEDIDDMDAMDDAIDAGNTLQPPTSSSYFRIRTASVSLKVDIHPPCGFNINHVEGETTHDRVIQQGEEILHFTVYQELLQEGIKIPSDSIIYHNLLCTSKGFLLLRWEKLCKTMHSYMLHNQPNHSLSRFMNKKCLCKRRIKKGKECNGFVCIVLENISSDESFSQKIAKLLFHTVCASRWSLQSGDPTLLEKILSDSLHAMDVICAEHDNACQGGWDCVMAIHTPPSNTFSLRNLVTCPLFLAITTAGIITMSFLISRLFINSKNR